MLRASSLPQNLLMKPFNLLYALSCTQAATLSSMPQSSTAACRKLARYSAVCISGIERVYSITLCTTQSVKKWTVSVMYDFVVNAVQASVVMATFSAEWSGHQLLTGWYLIHTTGLVCFLIRLTYATARSSAHSLTHTHCHSRAHTYL